MTSNKATADVGSTPSHEAYVRMLYQTVLGREPDEEGLRHHVSALQRGVDPMQVMADFANSAERREIVMHGILHKKQGRQTAASLAEVDLEFILDASRERFNDIQFFKRLSEEKISAATPRKIRNIAVYYWRMNNGGTERVTARQIQIWRNMGYNVILITDQAPDPLNDYEYGEDVPRFIIPERMMANNNYRPRGRALADILTQEKIDLFITNQWYEISSIWDILVAKSLGIGTVLGWHNSFDAGINSVDDLSLAYLRFLGYKNADLVGVLSNVDKAWFDTWGVPAKLVHNPLTFEHLPKETAPLEGKTLIWVARAERHQKRIDQVLQMFPLVLAEMPDARLVIVGGGPDLDWAREYVDALGIAGNVHFTGYQKNVSKYIAQASIHVMTSEFEGYPMVLGEVWAHGVPTILFDLPHLEYLRREKGHIVVPQGAIEDMAKEAVKLLKDVDERRRLGAEARRVVEDIVAQDVGAAWKQIFDQFEIGDVRGTNSVPLNDLKSMQILLGMLSQKMMSFNRGNFPDPAPLPILPSAARRHPPKRRSTRFAVKAFEQVSKPYKWLGRSLRNQLIPDHRLRMIDLSHVGLGDNMMLWAGLYALLSNGVEICAPGCAIHVQPILGDLAARFFEPFGLKIHRGRPPEHISPIFTPMPPENSKQWWGTYIGRDWYMNWVEALDQQKTFPRNGADLSFAGRVRLAVSERLLYHRNNWAEATPGYIGYRVWLPLALKNGIYPLTFMAQIKRSLKEMRQIFAEFVDASTLESERTQYSGNAAFPTGKSFQTISPQFYKALNIALGGDFFTCYIQNDSAWWQSYETSGVEAKSLPNLMETFRIIKYADNLLTTDSFTSHIAQFLRDDFVLVLSRDMKEGILHPGANPTIMANHPACAPCNYQERYHFNHCVAGYEYCTAFQSSELLDGIIRHFRD
ncbi:glycosyltransferase [Novosphingobium humi]|uniref:Glycosyltransferase n=1 Tax=Novosphingobium humi TaxID=2282397 RepID=A0ABY7TVT4_9SPHN|nr:glycosyltransferase [Novosphingobium humi]WCT77372.1 glycosyltransferase [Novosphingobium humi]